MNISFPFCDNFVSIQVYTISSHIAMDKRKKWYFYNIFFIYGMECLFLSLYIYMLIPLKNSLQIDHRILCSYDG